MIVFFTKLKNISIYVSLEENTGTYTLSAKQIQELINGIPADGLEQKYLKWILVKLNTKTEHFELL